MRGGLEMSAFNRGCDFGAYNVEGREPRTKLGRDCDETDLGPPFGARTPAISVRS